MESLRGVIIKRGISKGLKVCLREIEIIKRGVMKKTLDLKTRLMTWSVHPLRKI